MHRSTSPVVSTRPRSPRRGTRSALSSTSRVSAPAQRPMEALESRVLFAAGDLDLTFGGGDGAALINFGAGSNDFGSSIVALPGGKSLVGGAVRNGANEQFGLARLNADGSLDTTFGTGGLATLSFGAGATDLQSLAVGSDGKIVAVGSFDAGLGADWAVARFNADGTPDTTFGTGGKVTTDFFGFTDNAYGVDLQPDGKIVVTGVATGVDAQMMTVRYTTTGALDTTFNTDGKQSIDVFGGDDFGANVKVQSDGKIIVVGGSVQPGSYRRFVLARINSNGTLDTTFDGDGEATADFGSAAFGKDVEQQPDGKYVVGGWLDTGTTDDQLDFAVARFNANGSVDNGFGTSGRTVVHNTGGDTFGAYGLELQQNGKILLGGTTHDANYSTNLRTYAGVARLNVNGTPDTTFGPGGLRQFSMPGADVGSTKARDLELASDGSILVAGYATATGGNTDFAVAKLQNNDGPPPTPGSVSGVVYNDANENGVRDAGEAGLPGWTVFQDLNNNGVFDSGPTTFTSTDVPKVISETGTPTVISNLVVSGAGSSISDVNVTLDISHTWDDDLTVSLISPGGQEIILFSNVGSSGDNFTNTTLDDEASTSIDNPSLNPPFTGTFMPHQPLSGLDGTDPNGTWQLKIRDESDPDGGSLNSWSIKVTSAPEPSTTTAADGSYSFANLQPGDYTIREVPQAGWSPTVPASGANLVTVGSGQAVANVNFGNTNRVIPAAVAGRHVFYNNSSFDGNSSAANAQDDGAIATDKQALQAIDTATLANVTSYNKGINGVMVDIARLKGTLAADDFDFAVGTSNFPPQWTAAPAPVSITQRPAPDGSTRVTIVWADNAVKNEWLAVKVKANAHTGIGSDDVFYFGNLVGDTVAPEGGSTTMVSSSDLLATRNARSSGAVSVTSAADHNRDGRVNVLDEAIVRANLGNTLNLLVRPRSGDVFGATPIVATAMVASAPATRSRIPITRSVLS